MPFTFDETVLAGRSHKYAINWLAIRSAGVAFASQLAGSAQPDGRARLVNSSTQPAIMFSGGAGSWMSVWRASHASRNTLHKRARNC